MHLTSFTLILGTILITTQTYLTQASGINFACPDLHQNTGQTGAGRVGEKWTNNVKSWEDCSALCQTRSGCKYWTWHHANSGYWANKCVTMTDAGGKTYNKDVLSGKRSCTGGSCAARKPSNIPCYQIRDRKTCLEAIDQREYWRSPCGWCFGKHCPGTLNLCEPKKWFDNGRLKAGQDYEDCLKLRTIKNPGKDCWHACGSKSGQCNDFCGSGNYCCRQGSNWIEKGCDGKVGGKGRHECASNIGSKSECKNIKLNTNIWGQEISWKFGSCQSPPGYGENVHGKYANHKVYNIKCCQPPGTYELDCKDKFGDGWNGASIEIAGREYCKDFRTGRSKKQQVRH